MPTPPRRNHPLFRANGRAPRPSRAILRATSRNRMRPPWNEMRHPSSIRNWSTLLTRMCAEESTTAEDVAKIKAPLLIHYGGLDDRGNAGWPAFEAALEANHVTYTAYIYEGPITASTTIQRRATTRPRPLWPGTARWNFSKKHCGNAESPEQSSTCLLICRSLAYSCRKAGPRFIKLTVNLGEVVLPFSNRNRTGSSRSLDR